MVAPGSIPGDLTEAGLKVQALRLAPGMQPDGTELKQAMTEGQHAVVMVTRGGQGLHNPGLWPLGGVMIPPCWRPRYMTLAGQI